MILYRHTAQSMQQAATCSASSKMQTGGNETLVKQLDRELGSIQRNIDATRDALRDLNSTPGSSVFEWCRFKITQCYSRIAAGEEDTAE